MNRSLFWTTFFTVFLAEVGDKTQLAAMTATVRSGALWTVFLSASAALVCATAIGVALGGVLFRVIPEAAIKWAAGLAFIGVGLWVLARG
jgi:putative Ca2+/H+ antiporter (TMEM165/GDT1 family)